MWNDTVRKQSESSFITGDINSSASLNRGNYKLFFLSLTLVMAVMSLKYIAPFFPLSSLPQMASDPIHSHKKCCVIKWEEVLWWLFPVFFSFSIFTYAFLRTVISGRELGKDKKKKKWKKKPPPSPRQTLSAISC